MIPASSIHFNDDDTAWWVVKPVHRMGVTNTAGDDNDDPSWFMSLDRPCDCTLGRSGAMTDCGGTGRHTFDLEVSFGAMTRGFRIVRASVEPGVVLPVADQCPDMDPPDHICRPYRDEQWVWHRDLGSVTGSLDDPTEILVDLPPDARPGLWAVLLEVHQ
jgi:hypothetical protein